MRTTRFFASVLILFIGCQQEKFDLIIRGATIYDGSGDAAYIGDVGIRGDTIAELGDLGSATSDKIVEGKGMALAPGFIDTHSHHDSGMNSAPDALSVVSQGITTIIVGQDGDSFSPLKRYFDHLSDSPVAVNIGSYSGHNTIRSIVMGKDFKRHATDLQIEQMISLLKADMDGGALGLSTGLEYDPGIYSHGDEVLKLSKSLVPYHGRYISHLRSEDRYFWHALDEIITIGKETGLPVQISHFKLAMQNLWGRADSTLAILERARSEGIDITADLYPYPYWSSDIRVLFPDRNFDDEKEAAFILREVTTAEGIIFSNYSPNPEYNGKSLMDASTIEKLSPEKTLVELIRRLNACDEGSGACSGSIVATSMDDADIKKLLQWKHTNVCSDGASSGRHPRGFGAFTRVLSVYVREQQTLSLAEAIRKMTSLSADNLGIKKRGRIKAGYYADLVLFEPSTVKDNATIANPQTISTGILKVWVNGTEVFNGNETSGFHPGKVILRN